MTKAKNASETMALGYNCPKMVIASEYTCQTIRAESCQPFPEKIELSDGHKVNLSNLFQSAMAIAENCQTFLKKI